MTLDELKMLKELWNGAKNSKPNDDANRALDRAIKTKEAKP